MTEARVCVGAAAAAEGEAAADEKSEMEGRTVPSPTNQLGVEHVGTPTAKKTVSRIFGNFRFVRTLISFFI